MMERETRTFSWQCLKAGLGPNQNHPLSSESLSLCLSVSLSPQEHNQKIAIFSYYLELKLKIGYGLLLTEPKHLRLKLRSTINSLLLSCLTGELLPKSTDRHTPKIRNK